MRHFYVGLFVIVTLVVLGFYTLFMADVALFGGRQEVRVQFESAGGLREGDSVLLAGRRTGRVLRLTYDPAAPRAQRITAVITLEEGVELREGYSIRIVEATALGGRRIEIEPGEPGSVAVALDSALTGEVAPGLFESLAGFGEAFSGEGDGLMAKVDRIVTELDEGGAAKNLNTSLENFASASEDIAKLTDDLAAGRGTLGALFASNELYDTFLATGKDVQEAATEVEATFSAAREGEGLLPALLNDPELKTEGSDLVKSASATFENLEGVTADIRAGKGLVGKLLGDEATAESGANIVANLEKVSKDLADGKGTIGRLFASDELYVNANKTFADLASVTDKLAKGEGTMGKLFMDDELARELNLAVKTLTRSLEDYREAAPVSTLTSVLFSAF